MNSEQQNNGIKESESTLGSMMIMDTVLKGHDSFGDLLTFDHFLKGARTHPEKSSDDAQQLLHDEKELKVFIHTSRMLFQEENVDELSDGYLARFFKACQGHKGEAMSMFSEHLSWRTEFMNAVGRKDKMAQAYHSHLEASQFLWIEGTSYNEDPVLYCCFQKLLEYQVDMTTMNDVDDLKDEQTGASTDTLPTSSTLETIQQSIDSGTESTNLKKPFGQWRSILQKKKPMATVFGLSKSRPLLKLMTKNNTNRQILVHYICQFMLNALTNPDPSWLPVTNYAGSDKSKARAYPKFVVIVDRTNMTDEPSMTLSKMIIPILERNFPECLDRMLVFPSTGSHLKNVQNLMHGQVVGKTYLRENASSLLEVMDASQIPKYYRLQLSIASPVNVSFEDNQEEASPVSMISGKTADSVEVDLNPTPEMEFDEPVTNNTKLDSSSNESLNQHFTRLSTANQYLENVAFPEMKGIMEDLIPNGHSKRANKLRNNNNNHDEQPSSQEAVKESDFHPRKPHRRPFQTASTERRSTDKWVIVEELWRAPYDDEV